MFNYQAGSEDIEDIAAQQVNGINYLLVGNIGSHAQTGAKRRLYLIKEPLADQSTARLVNLIAPETRTVIEFSWPKADTTLDCEGVALCPNGEILIATKESYKSRIFVLRTKILTGDAANSLRLMKTVSGSRFHRVSGFDMSADGRSLLFVNSSSPRHVSEYTLPLGIDSFASSSLSSWILHDYTGMIAGAPQPEGVCFGADGRYIYGTTELGGNRGSSPSKGFIGGGQTPLYVAVRNTTQPAP